MKKIASYSVKIHFMRVNCLMNIGVFLFTSVLLAGCFSSGTRNQDSIYSDQVVQGRGDRPPNILFIYTDDQAPWAIGLADQDDLRTPNMDRIGKEGAYLPNFFTTTPVCSPARATLLTSRYGTEVGITDWIKPTDKGQSFVGAEPDLGLDSSYVTWPELLEQAGYATGLVGKWHLGTLDRFHPTHHGYDYFMGFRGGGMSVTNPNLEKDGRVKEIEGFTTEILTDHALDFIGVHQDEPFLLSLHYRAPHRRWLPVPEDIWRSFENMPVKLPNPNYPRLDKERLITMTRKYYASIVSVDRQIGRILSVLDSLKLAENTVVIFTSDHGYNMGHNGIWHKGNGHWIVKYPPATTKNIPTGQRPNLYDNSLRVPAVVRWPRKIQAGTMIKEVVSTLDWYPTLLEIAGVSKPDTTVIHGKSFAPLLFNQEIIDWNNELYAQYSTHHQSLTHMRMYRTQEWKLVRDFLNSERDELYHLSEDRAETVNRIGEEGLQPVVQELHERLLRKMEQINDPILDMVNPHIRPNVSRLHQVREQN